MTVDNYLESFQNINQVVEHCRGNFSVLLSLAKEVLDKTGKSSPTADEKKVAEGKAREAYLAMAFLCSLNREKYQDLLDNLSNTYISGIYEYSKTVVDAHSLVLHWKDKKGPQREWFSDGVNFNIIGEE